MITGGTQTHLLQVFRFLDRTRFRPRLFALRDQGDLLETARSLDVPVTTFGMRGTLRDPRDLVGLSRLVAAFRRGRVEVAHGYLLRGNFYAAVGARLAGVPVVVTSKRGLHEPSGRAERAAVAVSNRLSDTVTGNSPQVLEFTRTIEGSFAAPMEMIPSGIDIDRFSRASIAADARARLRAELGLRDEPVVGTAITFRPRKGFRMLFEAMAELRRTVPDAHVVIAGADEMPEEPAALARQLGLEKAIHLLGRRSDMPQVLSGFDIFVLPSESEGMSNAILEAMAMELPVVVTAVGGAPEQVEEGRSGYLVDYPDHRAMAQRLAMLLSSPGLRAQIADNARQRVVERYSARAMVGQIEDLYVRLLDGKRVNTE